MSIRYRCGECGAAFKIRDSQAGTRGRCPECRVKFDVPMQSELSEEEFAAAEKAFKSVHGSSPNLEAESSSGKSIEPASKPNVTRDAGPASSPKLKRPDTEQPSGIDASEKETPLPKKPQIPEIKKAVPPPVPPSAPKSRIPEPAESLNGDAEKELEADIPVLEEELEVDDFDAAEFLMDDSDPTAKKTAGLSTAQPAAAQKPATDALGRRYYGAAPKVAPGTPSPEDVGASVVTKATLPAAPERRKIDWKAARKDLQRRWWLFPVFALLAIGSYWIAGRYFTPGLPLPALASVNGIVLLDGKPLPGVIVHLTPINATQATSSQGKTMRLGDAVGVTGKTGEYNLNYLGRTGSPLGKARIWIEPVQRAEYKSIPGKYLLPGPDIRDVREAGNDISKFKVEMKTE